jgi:hypothetical protein
VAQTLGCPHHFNSRIHGITRTETFLRSLCSQVIRHAGLPYPVLPTEATRHGGFLNRLLEEAVARPDRQSGPLVIVVDALDEAERAMPGANTLLLPDRPPPGIAFLVTTRPGPVPLRTDCTRVPVELGRDTPGSREDIADYVRLWLDKPENRTALARQAVEERDFVAALQDRSGGNFMYLRCVLADIAGDRAPGFSLASLPRGLKEYYARHWDLLRDRDERDWYDKILPVLAVLVTANDAVSADFLARRTGLASSRVVAVLQRDLAQFLHEEKDPGGRRVWRVYHVSFAEFLGDEAEVQAYLDDAERQLPQDLYNQLRDHLD